MGCWQRASVFAWAPRFCLPRVLRALRRRLRVPHRARHGVPHLASRGIRFLTRRRRLRKSRRRLRIRQQNQMRRNRNRSLRATTRFRVRIPTLQSFRWTPIPIQERVAMRVRLRGHPGPIRTLTLRPRLAGMQIRMEIRFARRIRPPMRRETTASVPAGRG
jgi:hypothetical protein